MPSRPSSSRWRRWRAWPLDGTLLHAYAETLKPLILGVAISAVLGIGFGLWIGLSARSDWLFSPIFIVMQAAPLAALIPLLVMAYGIGLTSKVFVVCIMAMPVIVLNTAGAVRNTPPSLKEMGTVLPRRTTARFCSRSSFPPPRR